VIPESGSEALQALRRDIYDIVEAEGSLWMSATSLHRI